MSPRPKTFRACLGIYLLLLPIYLACAPGHFSSLDHVLVYQTTESLVERGNFEVELLGNTIVRDGVAYAPYGPVQSMLTVPLYVAGREVDERASPETRRYLAGDTYWEGRLGGSVPIFFASLFNQLLTPLLCVVFFLLCVQFGFTQRMSFVVTLAFGLSTTLASGAHDFYQHPLEGLCVLTAAYFLVAHRHDPRPLHFFLAGACLSLGILTRINVIVLLPSFALYASWLLVQARTAGIPGMSWRERVLRYIQARPYRDVSFAIAAAIPLVLALAAWVAFNFVRYDSLWGYPQNLQGGIAIAAIPDALHGFLLSPGRSFFLYSPVAVLALFTFRQVLRERPAEALFFAAVALTYLCFYSLYLGWYGGPSWGPRYLMPAEPFVVLIAAEALRRGGAGARAFAALTGLGVLFQIPGAAINHALTFEDWRPLSEDFPESFLFVPRLSPLYRYTSDLLHGDNLDLWLEYVARENGAGVFLLTLAVPVAMLTVSVVLLRSAGLIGRPRPAERVSPTLARSPDSSVV